MKINTQAINKYSQTRSALFPQANLLTFQYSCCPSLCIFDLFGLWGVWRENCFHLVCGAPKQLWDLSFLQSLEAAPGCWCNNQYLNLGSFCFIARKRIYQYQMAFSLCSFSRVLAYHVQRPDLCRAHLLSPDFCYCFCIWLMGSKEEEMDSAADSVREEVTSPRDRRGEMSFPAGQGRVKRMSWQCIWGSRLERRMNRRRESNRDNRKKSKEWAMRQYD